ncbi:MAG: single-stranded DNA-binding protein [Chitinophagales bacterium]|nr:single-stranded DNA-binding protein [Chitinophagales bacterium]
MRGINKVILVGNLGKDPEVNHLESGVMVAKFPLATSESYMDKTGNRVDQTEWHNVVCWRKLGEIAEKYLKKGSKIYVEGKIRTRNYTDKENQKKYFTEIIADNFVMLDSKPDGSNSGNMSPATEGSDSISDEMADDLPF